MGNAVYDTTADTEQQRVASEISNDTDDYFDFVPDPIVLLIFNKLADVKALGSCSVVSKRFYELALKVENVSVKVDRAIAGEGKRKRLLSNLKRIVLGSILKPFQALNLFGDKKAMPPDVSDLLPGEILKNFKEIQHLRIELPAGELVFGHGVLLKWKAEFGSTLESCVILGASSLVKDKGPQKVSALKSRLGMVKNKVEHARHSVLSDEAENSDAHDENTNLPDTIYTDSEMKLRVVWTISSLIAATARHSLFKKIISDHPTLESLILTDATGQGTLCMSKEQLQNYRDNPSAGSASFIRTQGTSLSMRLWYAPYLQLSGGGVLKGATLVAIEPGNQAPRQDGDDFIAGAFEEPFDTATSKLSKRRTYLLEMRSL
ncbi:hypothetical protein O6H91_04G091100 [Diphasiastrum complanatum]|uniref:Uncharacterized protein n=1 Tax=Diphasiastrum complanatum TaxID=34168 RepID=A0ACC2DYY7_DIPCM|nr:hypothetical protein O6H91_04G091100 [Diphasiastrum complanatum]